jgi:hypothetical protein
MLVSLAGFLTPNSTCDLSHFFGLFQSAHVTRWASEVF